MSLPAILAENNLSAPLWLRCNPRRISAAQGLASLREARVDASASPWVEGALCLPDPLPVDSLPGWREGAFTVQDGAAQLAVAALDPQPGERVLDACAAPGGKTAQIAECLLESGELLALDIEARRIRRVGELLDRLGLASPRVETRVADAADTAAWWDGRGFDAILLDAPCSATGIIRRQPDIKWHRRASDIPVLVAQQARLLDALWPLLKPGGRLLYATCSILRDENERQVAAFLGRTPGAVAIDPGPAYGQASGAGRQRLPGEHGMDGFFYARLVKPA